MAFTPGFENDIFISYCHDDNDAPRDESGWVDHFHERLESSLVQRFGRKQIAIWRDKELLGITLFDHRIQERIAKSALFLALISPNYLRSDYCRQELAWFFDEAQKSTYGLSVNHEYRILPVFLRNIGHTAWPRELKGITGFPMHDQEEGSDSLGDFLDYDDKPYKKKLNKIAAAVETILKLFPGAGAKPGERTRETKDDEEEKKQKEEQERLQKEKTTRLAKEAEEEQRRQEEQERLLREQAVLLEKQTAEQRLNDLTTEITKKEIHLKSLAWEIGVKARLLEAQAEDLKRSAYDEKMKAEEREKAEQALIARVKKLEEDGKKLLDRNRQLDEKAALLENQVEQLQIIANDEKIKAKEREHERQSLIAHINKLNEDEEKLAVRNRQLDEKAALLEIQVKQQQSRIVNDEKMKAMERENAEQILNARMNKLKQDEEKLAERERLLNEKTELLKKKANYNLAPLFDEKAMQKLIYGHKTNDRTRFRDAWLYMTEALRQEIDGENLPLRPASAGALLIPPVANAALGERWVSPEVYNGSSSVYTVAFSPDGRTIASGAYKTIRLWDRNSQKEIAVLTGHTHWVNCVTFSPDGRTIASGSSDNTSRLWDKESQKKVAALKGHKGSIYSVAFSPDGRTIASGSFDKTIRLWDKDTGKEIATLTGHTGWVSSVAFSPDGWTIASGSGDKTIRLWDVNSRKEIDRLKGHTDSVRSVAFSPDGQNIVSGSGDNTIRLWDRETKKAIACLKGHEHCVYCVAFSPDGKIIASASNDKTIRLWDKESQKEVAALKGHKGSIYSVAFSPDRQTIASGASNTIRLWDVRLFNLFLKGGKPTPLFFTFAEGAEFFWGYRVEGLEIKEVGRPANPDKKFLPLLDKPAPGQSKFEQILAWAEAQERNK